MVIYNGYTALQSIINFNIDSTSFWRNILEPQLIIHTSDSIYQKYVQIMKK